MASGVTEVYGSGTRKLDMEGYGWSLKMYITVSARLEIHGYELLISTSSSSPAPTFCRHSISLWPITVLNGLHGLLLFSMRVPTSFVHLSHTQPPSSKGKIICSAVSTTPQVTFPYAP